MEHKTFLEVMAGADNLNLSRSQKRALRKVHDVGAFEGSDHPEEMEQSAQMASHALINSEDSRNLIAAVKMLSQAGYMETEPQMLGPHEEPTSVTLTQKGKEAVDDNNIANDQALLTPSEMEQSQPSDQTADGMDSGLPDGEEIKGPFDDEIAGEEDPKKAKGDGMELELSSFFKEIDQNRKFIKN